MVEAVATKTVQPITRAFPAEKAKAGDRYPNNAKAILLLLNQLMKQKRIPKKRRYSRNQEES